MQGFPLGAAVTIDELAADPHPILARLREEEPVSWVPALGGWLVTRRDLCIEVMRDAEIYTVDDSRFSTQQVIGPSMLSLDGADHRRHREPFVEPFRPEAIQELSHWTHDRAQALVAEVEPLGRADLRADLAGPLAVETMTRILSLDGVGTGEVLAWYEAIVSAVHTVTAGGDVPEEGKAAYSELGAAVATNVESSPLLDAVRSSGELSVDEMVANVAVLLFGGIVTAESTTSLALQYLLAEPAVLAVVDADRTLVADAVEEALRLEPSASVVDRYATRAVRLGEASIEEGDLVRVSLAGANRDPKTFPDPDRFDLRRPNSRQHLAFARGPHLCLGMHLSRLQTRAALTAVLDGLDGISLDKERYRAPEGLVFRAPKTVHASWMPR